MRKNRSGLVKSLMLASALGLGAVFLSGGCDSDSNSDSWGERQNEPPETEITKWGYERFLGDVIYSLKGTDSNGNVKLIYAELNGEGKSYINSDATSEYNKVLLVPIKEGDNANEITATARDAEEAEDPSPAELTDFFYSPAKFEAREIMDKVFGERANDYSNLEKDAQITSLYKADYFITTKDGRKVAVDYIKREELFPEIYKIISLHNLGIDVVHFTGIPLPELETMLNSLVDNNFTTSEDIYNEIQRQLDVPKN